MTEATAPLSGSAASSRTAKPKASVQSPIRRYLARFDDGELVRWIFRGVLAGAIGVLAMDFYDLYQANARTALETTDAPATPMLPPAFEPGEPLPEDPRKFVTGDPAALRAPMQFSLGAAGVLMAQGSIDPGAAARLATELDARGEYVKTVSLNSPGGALQDAIDMAKLVHDRKLNTEVADGALCASSCPLFFAGGKERLAGAEAAIGVHQFFATATVKDPTARPDAAKALSDAQITTARITRHLTDMGVDPAIWLHALDTPPQSLYYFSKDELSKYKLATGVAKAKPEAAALPGTSAPKG